MGYVRDMDRPKRGRAAIAALFSKPPPVPPIEAPPTGERMNESKPPPVPPALEIRPISHGESLAFNEGHRAKAREVFGRLPRYPGPPVRKSVQAMVLEATGGGMELIEFFTRAARGEMLDPHDPEGVIKVDPKDRIAAAKWLADRGVGKAPDVVQVITEPEETERIPVAEATIEELETLARITKRAREEATPALPEGETTH